MHTAWFKPNLYTLFGGNRYIQWFYLSLILPFILLGCYLTGRFAAKLKTISSRHEDFHYIKYISAYFISFAANAYSGYVHFFNINEIFILGAKSLENFKINCVKCYCPILLTELIYRVFRWSPIIARTPF